MKVGERARRWGVPAPDALETLPPGAPQNNGAKGLAVRL